MNQVRRIVKARSGGRCEAEVEIRGRWLRCTAQGSEVHHMVLRSRGGRNLDYDGETYHLIHLCSRCHGQAHSNYETGLIIEGSVQWDHLLGRPVYTGPDEYLSKHYPQSSSNGKENQSSRRC